MFLSKTKIFLFLLTIDHSASTPIPSGECHETTRNCPIKQAVDTYNTSATIALYGLIEEWDTSLVTDMSALFVNLGQGPLFFQNHDFNEDISKWDVSNVNTMQDMFHGAVEFNADISEWDVSKVDNAIDMFAGATDFNADISEWNMSPNQIQMMFHEASAFDQDISKWDFSKVFSTTNMFNKATAFNNGGKPLTLNTGSKLVNTRAMFAFCTSFDQTVTMYTGQVTSMFGMFYETTAFTNGGVPLTIDMPVGALDVDNLMFKNSAYQVIATQATLESRMSSLILNPGDGGDCDLTYVPGGSFTCTFFKILSQVPEDISRDLFNCSLYPGLPAEEWVKEDWVNASNATALKEAYNSLQC